MRQLTTDHLTALLADQQSPCISLYQPTHRHHPENQQDPIRYRNLLREMEKSLREKYPTREVRALLEKFQALSHDNEFWNHRTDGLLIFGSPEKFQHFELQRPVKELLVVADSFHVKPLLRALQSADRFQILCLNRHEAKLYEGNRDALAPVELTDMPVTLTEVLGSELTEPHQTVASYGKGAGGAGTAMHHGHGGKKDEVDIDMDRFFRAIDRSILEHHSRPSGLPLMLAALTEYHAPFRAVSHNPFLMAEGLSVNPESLSMDELRARAWQKVEPLYLERLAKLVESYQVAWSRQQGSDDLAEVVGAALNGRVGVLLLEADRLIPGRINAGSGQIEPGELADTEIGDILDDLAELALRMKGEVVVVPAERMPVTTGVAAIYRF
ncbi:MAG: hypothetical protein ABI882_19845 [Acidobacteriota bacterium]